MELSESGIVEFFDGTFIDLSRILEVGAVRASGDIVLKPFGYASFNIRYMFQESERTFGFTGRDILSQDEIDRIHRKHSDAAQSYGGKDCWSMANAEFQRITDETVNAHRSALIEAWRGWKLAHPSGGNVPRVAAGQ
jgi:hypothetical protein